MATRRERVVLELEDNFTTGMARAAASAALLNRELNSLSRDSVRTRAAVSDIDRPIEKVGRSSNASGREVDKLSGRMRILADVAAVLGPALIPIGAVGVPAITGLAAQLGFAAIAGGTVVLAFHGIGDALKALNEYQLEPTEAHLRSLQEKMSAIGPAGRDFVRELQDLRPVLQKLQDTAQAGLLPGVTDGLESLEKALPRVESIIATVSSELGDIASDAGASLASDRWTPFLDFVEREAPQALADMADAAGNTIHALAELWMAFDPLNDDFSSWLVRATEDLDKWATGLSKTQGFREFVAYVEANGPQVADTFGAIANAVIQIVEAASPLGGPVLKGVGALANLVAGVADSDLGTPIFTAVAALALLNRTLAITSSLQGKTFGGPAITQVRGYGASIRGLSADLVVLQRQASLTRLPAKGFIGPLTEAQTALTRVKASAAGLGKTAALLGGLTIASTGVADQIGLTNTASLALMGTLAGPWGAAVGGAVGLMLDAKAAASGFSDAMKGVDDVIARGTTDQLTAKLDQLRAARNDLTSTSGVGDFIGDSVTKYLKHGTFGASATDRLDAQIEKVQDALSGTAPGLSGFSGGLFRMGNAASTSAAQIQGLVDAMKAQRQEALNAFSAETRYRQALKDAQAQGRESNAGIKGSSDEALKNRQLIEGLAAAWNDQSDAVKNNRARFREARTAFIESATAMGVPEEAAKRLAKRLLEIPDKKVINAHLNADQAMDAVTALKRLMDSLHDRNIRVKVTGTTNANIAEGAIAPADGTTVPGPRYPYGDKVPALLAPGEEVVSNRYGQADKWRPFLKAINANRLADGGTAVSTTRTAAAFRIPSVTVLFPTPAQLSSAVRAAEQVAAASAKTARTAKDVRQDHLDDLHTQQQIRDIQRELDARIKKGKHKGEYELRGLDRKAALAELEDAKAQLKEIRNRARDALADARQAAVEAQRQARSDTLDTLNGTFDLFSRGLSPARAQAAVQQQISDVAQYGQTVAQLKAAGASPLLLRQVVAHAEAGDFRSAIRFGQAMLANPVSLGQLNTSLASLDSITGSVATLTTDPRFLSSAPWNPTNQVAKVVQIQLVADPSAMMLDLQRTIQHEVSLQLQASMS